MVRHADAGHRSDWPGSDEERPLSRRGERQAQGICDLLEDSGITRLVASPYQRCIDTLVPLAKLLGLEVEPDERLAEGAGAAGVLELADEAAGTAAALCSHGDVIPDFLDALLRQGVKLRDELKWQKASTWVCSREGGRISKGRYLPPPA